MQKTSWLFSLCASAHNSPYYINKYNGKQLINTVLFSGRLVRLPLYYELTKKDQKHIIKTINEFYKS